MNGILGKNVEFCLKMSRTSGKCDVQFEGNFRIILKKLWKILFLISTDELSVPSIFL